MSTVRDAIDDGIAAALATISGAEVDFDPAGEPDTFPNLAVFRGDDHEIEREADITRREGTFTVEGTIEYGSGREANAARNALHAAAVAAIMADQTLGGAVELIDPDDVRFARAPFASTPRLWFAQDFTVQFVTKRNNPALPG